MVALYGVETELAVQGKKQQAIEDMAWRMMSIFCRGTADAAKPSWAIATHNVNGRRAMITVGLGYASSLWFDERRAVQGVCETAYARYQDVLRNEDDDLQRDLPDGVVVEQPGGEYSFHGYRAWGGNRRFCGAVSVTIYPGPCIAGRLSRKDAMSVIDAGLQEIHALLHRG